MRQLTFMLIAGEASGDLLAAELVSALLAASKQSEDGRAPQFFGAGGFTNLRNGCKNES
jgi:lipid A disaccharide synthetase